MTDRPIVFAPNQVGLIVIARIALLGKTVPEFAKDLGVSARLVYLLANNHLKPSASVAQKLRLRVVYGTQPSGRRMQPDTVIAASDFPTFLNGAIGNDSVKDFSAKLGVTPKLIYLLLQGKRKPSAAILKKVGLQTYYTVDGPADA